MEICGRLGLTLHELFHFQPCKEIVSAVNRQIANTYLRHIAKRLSSAIDKYILRIHKIGIDVLCLGYPAIVKDKFLLAFAIRKPYHHHMHMGFLGSLTVPAECAAGEVYIYARVYQRLLKV